MIITSLDLLEIENNDKNATIQSFLDSKIINDRNLQILNLVSLLKKLLAYSKSQIMQTQETVGLQEMNTKILNAISEQQQNSKPFY